MSPRAPSVCVSPGCTRPAPPGQSKCEPHRLASNRQADQRRPNSTARGYDSTWRRYARSYLQVHPVCVICGGKAEHVDHIDGLGPKGPRGYDPANLQPVCAADHARLPTSLGRAKRQDHGQ